MHWRWRWRAELTGALQHHKIDHKKLRPPYGNLADFVHEKVRSRDLPGRRALRCDTRAPQDQLSLLVKPLHEEFGTVLQARVVVKKNDAMSEFYTKSAEVPAVVAALLRLSFALPSRPEAKTTTRLICIEGRLGVEGQWAWRAEQRASGGCTAARHDHRRCVRGRHLRLPLPRGPPTSNCQHLPRAAACSLGFSQPCSSSTRAARLG